MHKNIKITLVRQGSYFVSVAAEVEYCPVFAARSAMSSITT